MSRIARVPVVVPAGVTVHLDHQQLLIQGPKGKLSMKFPFGYTLSQEDQRLVIKAMVDNRQTSPMLGTLYRVVKNMIIGVTEKFEKKLDIVGIGYKAESQGNSIKFSLGYSHEVRYHIPEDITIVAEKPTLLTISGADKQKVGQVATEIMALRPVEAYKGKGIGPAGVVRKKKEGKSK